jgi:DNA-binding ferritin-like protein
MSKLPALRSTHLLKRISDAQKNIAAERDKLRELIEDATDLAETCDEAHDALENAADALSKYL